MFLYMFGSVLPRSAGRMTGLPRSGSTKGDLAVSGALGGWPARTRYTAAHWWKRKPCLVLGDLAGLLLMDGPLAWRAGGR